MLPNGNWEIVGKHTSSYEGNRMTRIIEITLKCLDCNGTGKDDNGKKCENCDGEGYMTIQE